VKRRERHRIIWSFLFGFGLLAGLFFGIDLALWLSAGLIVAAVTTSPLIMRARRSQPGPKVLEVPPEWVLSWTAHRDLLAAVNKAIEATQRVQSVADSTIVTVDGVPGWFTVILPKPPGVTKILTNESVGGVSLSSMIHFLDRALDEESQERLDNLIIAEAITDTQIGKLAEGVLRCYLPGREPIRADTQEFFDRPRGGYVSSSALVVQDAMGNVVYDGSITPRLPPAFTPIVQPPPPPEPSIEELAAVEAWSDINQWERAANIPATPRVPPPPPPKPSPY
jgi:hypothetical protein